MNISDKRALAIILHSGSYDRLYQAMSISLTALALGRITVTKKWRVKR
jgi:peroxiredoxin family protein